MNDQQDPVIVRALLSTSRRCTITLADVLITPADDRNSGEHLADLFREYPGLTLALIAATPHRLTVGIRDGSVIAVRFACGRGPTSESVDALARFLYRWWSVTNGQPSDPRAQSSSARGTQAVEDVECPFEVSTGTQQVSACPGDPAQQIESFRLLER